MGACLRAGSNSQNPQKKEIDIYHNPLDPAFYQNPDVLAIAKSLIGKGLFTKIGNVVTGGIIIEAEAYAGVQDRASHVYGDRRTKRTEAMYGPGGIAYVYLCYGMHYLMNAVTNVEGVAQAVLIRALHPTHGIETMLQRRGQRKLGQNLTSGPGSLCKALGITLEHYAIPLNSQQLWIANLGIAVEEIEATPRIGVDYAGEDASLLYRFVLKKNSIDTIVALER